MPKLCIRSWLNKKVIQSDNEKLRGFMLALQPEVSPTRPPVTLYSGHIMASQDVQPCPHSPLPGVGVWSGVGMGLSHSAQRAPAQRGLL